MSKRGLALAYGSMVTILIVGTVGLNTDWFPTSETNALADWRMWAIVAVTGWTATMMVVLWWRRAEPRA